MWVVRIDHLSLSKLKVMKKTIIIIILIIGLMSCSTGKIVYDGGKGWESMSNKSNVTGWNYK